MKSRALEDQKTDVAQMKEQLSQLGGRSPAADTLDVRRACLPL
jgi:hypothetical protein